MIKGNKLQEFGFVSAPFPLMPTTRVNYWAGRPEEKQHLSDIIESVLTTDVGLSEFAVIHGEYGSGKSHAMRYLTTLINETDQQHFQSNAIYIKTIRLEQKLTFERIFREIIEMLGFEFLARLGSKIDSTLKEAAEKLTESADKKLLKILLADRSKLRTQVLETNVPEEDRSMVQLLTRIADGDDKAKEFLLSNNKALPEIGFSNPINSDYTATKVLGSLFRTMTLSIADKDPVCRGTYLFIDEVESVLEGRHV